jgi:hypothetical protein
MTKTKSTAPKPAQIDFRTVRGHVIPRVRYRVFDIEGGLALVFIFIILAARADRKIIKFVYRLIRPVARWAWHHIVGSGLALRAFYIP